MSLNVILTRKQIDEAEELKARVFAPMLMGECISCHRGIPAGYLAIVTRWRTLDWAKGFPVHKPVDMYCQDCAGAAPYQERHRRHKHPPSLIQEEQSEVLTPKQVAVRILSVMSTTEGHNSKWIASEAELDEESIPVIKDILRRLRDAGVVVFEEGKWRRVK